MDSPRDDGEDDSLIDVPDLLQQSASHASFTRQFRPISTLAACPALIAGTRIRAPSLLVRHTVLPGETLVLPIPRVLVTRMLADSVASAGSAPVVLLVQQSTSEYATIAQVVSLGDDSGAVLGRGRARLVGGQISDQMHNAVVRFGPTPLGGARRMPREAHEEMAHARRSVWRAVDEENACVRLRRAWPEGMFVAELPARALPAALLSAALRLGPFTDAQRTHIVDLPVSVALAAAASIAPTWMSSALVCKNCRQLVAGPAHLARGHIFAPWEQTSPLTTLFSNPAGQAFRLLLLGSVTAGVASVTALESAYSWFPGYSWSILCCNACVAHLGWEYVAGPSNSRLQNFYGLIQKSIDWEARD